MKTALGEPDDFRPGDRVTITEGPFKDYDAIVDKDPINPGLIRVLLTIFGREAPIEVEHRQIRRAD